MLRRFTIILTCTCLYLGCGGDLTVDGEGISDASEFDTARETDAGKVTPTEDLGNGDLGRDSELSGETDAGQMGDAAEDMAVEDVWMAPTENVPQSGPSVEQKVQNACTTESVKGLSLQLIDQMNCLEPGIMKSFAGAPDITYSSVVFPFLQGPATDAFTDVAANNAGEVPVTSATRTLPQQYLLYRWYQLGLCNANLAASPGRSNHNGGLAIDIGNYGTWAPRMRAGDFDDNVSGEPWHFKYIGPGGQDVRNLSVLAFQKLYNLNFPEDPIIEDGLYGPQTEGAMQDSPADGFTVGPHCMQTMSLAAYPFAVPMAIVWDWSGALVGLRAIAPGGVEEVEFYVDGILEADVSRAETPHFDAVVERRPARDRGTLTIEAVGYDVRGVEQSSGIGWIFEGAPSLSVRPLGDRHYELALRKIPRDAARVVVQLQQREVTAGVGRDGDTLLVYPDLRLSPGMHIELTLLNADGANVLTVAKRLPAP